MFGNFLENPVQEGTYLTILCYFLFSAKKIDKKEQRLRNCRIKFTMKFIVTYHNYEKFSPANLFNITLKRHKKKLV